MRFDYRRVGLERLQSRHIESPVQKKGGHPCGEGGEAPAVSQQQTPRTSREERDVPEGGRKQREN